MALPWRNVYWPLPAVPSSAPLLSSAPSSRLDLPFKKRGAATFAVVCCSSSPPSPSRKRPDVVVTREIGKNAKLVNALGKHNVHCLELPLVTHTEGPDTSRLPSLLRDKQFDWIIITSPEAASVFLDAWKAASRPRVQLGVVGTGTASVFHEVLRSSESSLEVAFSPSKATGKVLASELPNHEGGTCSVLYPASVKAGHEIEEGLSSRGFEITRLNTYNTIPVNDVDPGLLEEAVSVPVLAVASPSAIRAWISLVGREEWSNSVACIGETTASVAKRLGLKNVFYPSSPGLDGWVESILEALKSQQ